MRWRGICLNLLPKRSVALGWPSSVLGQLRTTHQETVALSGSAATLIDRPYDQALAAPAIPGGKNAGNVCRKLTVFGLGIGARIALDTELGQHWVFRPEETHGEQHQIGPQNLFRCLATRLGINAPCSFFVHSTS